WQAGGVHRAGGPGGDGPAREAGSRRGRGFEISRRSVHRFHRTRETACGIAECLLSLCGHLSPQPCGFDAKRSEGRETASFASGAGLGRGHQGTAQRREAPVESPQTVRNKADITPAENFFTSLKRKRRPFACASGFDVMIFLVGVIT